MVRDEKIKGWLLTYPQCEATKEELLQWLCLIDNVTEYVICREKHEDGNNHLHAHVKFETGIMKKNFRVFDLPSYTGHYEPTKSRAAAIRYCKKDGDFITNLNEETILSPQNKRAKFVHDVLKKKSVTQMIEDGDIHFAQAKAATYAKQLLGKHYEHTGVRGVWIQGRPGVGKTHKARNDYGDDLYIKPMNKWWDGYNGQAVVILDDFEKSCGPMLGHYLKIWADKWSCTGEIKGGQVFLEHKFFIITSNYSIEECFGEDREMRDAIARRFEIINM